MSVNRRLTLPVDDDKRNSKSALQQTSAPEIVSVDKRLERLKQEVLPFYPFLLTVPTDVPFRPGARFINNWAVGDDGPFTRDEQELQYMTFLTHQDGDSLLVAVGDWSDGTGNIMSDKRSGPQSAASTPSAGSLKKKISLNDYRNRRKSGASVSPINQVPVTQTSAPHTSEDKRSGVKATTSVDHSGKQSLNSLSTKSSVRYVPESVGRKRPPELGHVHLGSHEGEQADVVSSKKARLSPRMIGSKSSESSKTNGLPDLLSPTLPPTSDSPKLPRLLSPTLPPDIEKELARLDESRPVSSSFKLLKHLDSASSKENVQNPKPHDHGRLQPYATTGPSLHGRSLNSTADKCITTPIDSRGSDFGDTPNLDLQSQRGEQTPPSTDTKESMASKPRLVVKLKYGRSNRKRIEALLKFSAKRKAALTSSPINQQVDSEKARVTKAQLNESNTSALERTSHKSHRLEGTVKDTVNVDTSTSMKERSKEPRAPTPEKSRLPASPTPVSISNQSKNFAGSPTKDAKNSAARIETFHSAGKSTSHHCTKDQPGNQVNTSKSASADSDNLASRSRNSERRAWKDEYQRLGNLGRELKHAAERHTNKDAVTAADEKLAVVTAIEAVLCFILAFVADDQSKALARQVGDSSTWLSILAYWRVVRKNSAPYPRLHSLCLILGAVSYDAIHALDLERLAVTPLPGDHTPVPTPGSDGTTVTSDENKKNRRDIIELKNRLHDFYKESQRLWLEGLQGLSEDILAREFPDTWSRRSRRYSHLGKQKLKIGDYTGEFLFPPGKTSAPVETVRFGCAILREWCMKEGVDWSCRLDL
ncbi:uncharacterized protein P174DRAFT_431427 [Aspergillus novofumigatus IBT 16806]|uniref:Ell binding protein Ebp1 C-terminal domain-containing protein n=1 Tax=Aspergillus novofumigatus (strain IBT 16806) TaxID=1392255 RepID=A0A2I1CA52_ASPN1|nr:uncharacterized protein P174DRAFT_431427 [Aspergillus novofumigatus IBT 16806]PKX94510.1 hypothetical protein P174DRAFT_431427 [Aspergillus novofumigatus IBT 16806]